MEIALSGRMFSDSLTNVLHVTWVRHNKTAGFAFFGLMTDEIFHPLHTDLPVPEGFNNPFDYTPHPLCLRAVEEVAP